MALRLTSWSRRTPTPCRSRDLGNLTPYYLTSAELPEKLRFWAEQALQPTFKAVIQSTRFMTRGKLSPPPIQLRYLRVLQELPGAKRTRTNSKEDSHGNRKRTTNREKNFDRRKFLQATGVAGMGAAATALIGGSATTWPLRDSPRKPLLGGFRIPSPKTSRSNFHRSRSPKDLASTFYYNGLVGAVLQDPAMAGPGGTVHHAPHRRPATNSSGPPCLKRSPMPIFSAPC